jgi:hypothetical protein
MSSSLLPKHFWYEGMNKIKAGKGYINQFTGKQEVLGVQGGPCRICDGTIIALKMSSGNGFEVTSEKVCNKCGLIYPTAYQVLDKRDETIESKYTLYKKTITRSETDDALTKYYNKDGEKLYHSKKRVKPTKPIRKEYVFYRKDYTAYYGTHELWLEDNKPEGNPEDVASDVEQFTHIAGRRPNTVDNWYYGQPGKDEAISSMKKSDAKTMNEYEDDMHRQLGLKSKDKLGVRADQWNRGADEVLKHRLNQYYDYIGICKSMLGLNKQQEDEVKHIIKTRPNILNISRYSYEDIIYHICLRVRLLGMGRKGTSLMNTVRLGDLYNKTLYSLIVQTMDS